ncbi:uncharacterized protein LOC143018074 [Oratosquilla oratoria]|uniref:uncharacterized protein LOC143018074 n=1 Tax=Oratosquilla oratoria TaxID=337810 RepID=UPI003F760A49
MDDVFGNSSSETVVSSADWSRVLASLHQEIADLQFLELLLPPQTSQQQGSTTNLAHIVNRPNPNKKPAEGSDTTDDVSGSTNSINDNTNNGQRSCKRPMSATSSLQVHAGLQANKLPNGHYGELTSSSGGGGGGACVPVIAAMGKSSIELQHPQSLGKEHELHHPQQQQHQNQLQQQYQNQQQQQQQHVYTLGASVRPLSNTEAFHHTQSEVDKGSHQKPPHLQQQQCPRSKSALATIAVVESKQAMESLYGQQQQRPSSLYDNIPPLLPKASQERKQPAYVNVPPPRTPTTFASSDQTKATHVATPMPCASTPLKKSASSEITLRPPSPNSLPSTPKDFHKNEVSPSHAINHSYIQLWTGVREERDSLSDSECEEMRRASFLQDAHPSPPSTPSTPLRKVSPGYVEMSSPYIKSPCNGSVLADLAGKLANYAGHIPRNIFCPFCPRYFGYEKSLGTHIHKSHKGELETLLERRAGQVQLQFCPVCHARFLNGSVLAKHLSDFHRSCVIELLSKHQRLTCDASGLHCAFCPKKVPVCKTGEQVLLYHLMQVHDRQFDALIQDTFRPYTSQGSHESIKSVSTIDLLQVTSFEPGLTSTPGLSNKLGSVQLGAHDTSARSVDTVESDQTWSSHTGHSKASLPPEQVHQAQTQPTVPIPCKQDGQKPEQQHGPPERCSSKGILRYPSGNGLMKRPSVKRELRFSVPPVTSEEVFEPDAREHLTPPDPKRPEPAPRTTVPSQVVQKTTQRNGQAINGEERKIPIRIDSLSAADFIDMNEAANGNRKKRRKLGLGLRSRKAFKQRDKENINLDENVAMGATMVTSTPPISSITAPRTFRKPKPVSLPQFSSSATQHNHHGSSSQPNCAIGETGASADPKDSASSDGAVDFSPFSSLKLYSPLRMFRCNGCRVKFCDNEALAGHIGARHRGLLGLLRPNYGCGVCSARFYENKYLVKHCLQHHTSLLEIKSPQRHKITIYRFSHK